MRRRDRAEPKPDVEALAEALADVLGELSRFEEERDSRLTGGSTVYSSRYDAHLNNMARMAAYLAKKGWRLSRASDGVDDTIGLGERDFVTQEEAAKAAHDAEHPHPEWKAPEGDEK